MLTSAEIQQLVGRIVKMSEPNKVILFGSYATGKVTDDSDLDLMVIKPICDKKYEESVRLRADIGAIGIGVDILVFSQKEFDRRSQVPGTIPYWANKEGIAVYEAPH